VKAMKVKYENSLKYKLLRRIEQIQGCAILRSDIADLSDYRQLSRALKALIEDGYIVKLDYGIYVKVTQSQYTRDTIINIGFTQACIQILNRLGVKWDLTRAQKAYNERKTTQIPVRPSIRLKSRFRRTLSYGNLLLRYEDGVYAK